MALGVFSYIMYNQKHIKMKKYIFYEDGSHAWLKVSKKELKQLGIETKITGCSFMRNDFAYLEEDLDLSTFIEALAKTYGIDININNIDSFNFSKMFWSNIKRMYSNKESKLRNYDSYEFIPESTLAKMSEFKTLLLSKFNFNSKGIKQIKSASLNDCVYWNEYYNLNFKFD
jgi:hypothetical protein